MPYSYPTTPGVTYAVECAAEVFVTNPQTGAVAVSGDGSATVYFTATDTLYDISDDSAKVQPLFKLAPRLRLTLLQGVAGGLLPKGFTELEYLETSGTQYIDTGIVKSGEYLARFEYAAPPKLINGMMFGWRYDHQGTSYEKSFSFYSTSYFGRFVHWTSLSYILPPNFSATGYDGTARNVLETTSKANVVILNGETVYLNNTGNTRNAENPLNASIVVLRNTSGAKVFAFAIFNESGLADIDLTPVLDATGTPCMYDKVSRKCFYNKGTGSFIAGMTMGQLPALLHLPRVTSGELTLSLPWEAQLIASGAPAILEEVKNRGWTLIVQYAEPDTESAVYNKYAACTNRSDVEEVNPNYRNDLTSDGKWIYPLPNMVSVTQNPDPWFFSGSPVTELDIELPKLTEAYYVFRNASKLKKARVSLPVLTNNQRSFFEDCPLEELYVHAPNLTNLEAFIIGAKFTEITEDMIVHGDITNLAFFGRKMPNLRRVALSLPKVTYMTHSFTNCGLLTSFECDLPSLSNADSSFDRSILNKESTLRILNTIPSYSSGTHNLGLGIHIDHKTDEEVLTAIDNAEVKGWTLTVQWNGTATAAAASTYGLRKPPIYAKAATIERPDGTTEQTLDWGHYVTNWEENGYTEFASLEEAYAHFNLTMPE